MTDENKLNKKQIISLLIIGLGIGGLTGLSVSPVVSIVITSLIGVSITLASVFSGLKSKEKTNSQATSAWNIDSFPIALIILGIVIGSIFGIYARNNDLLGSNIKAEIRRWKAAGLTLSEEEIVQRLFYREYPYWLTTALIQEEIRNWKNGGLTLSEEEIAQRIFDREYKSRDTPITIPEPPSENDNGVVGTVLFSEMLIKECDRYGALSPKELSMNLRGAKSKIFKVLPNIIQDPETLQQVVKLLCEKHM